MATQYYTHSWSSGGESFSGTATITEEGSQGVDVTVPALTTNEEVDITLQFAKVTGIFLYSDVTLTVKTNSTSSPGDTLTVTAGIPLAWCTGCGLAKPLTVDVTKLYLTNATSGAATVHFRFQQDVTA